jgi:arylsulfatase A-like enzyme
MNFKTLVLFAVCLLAGGAARPAAGGIPNVIFVLVDDMGYADLGCYGSTDIRTPYIDRLAREGVRMTDFYSAAPVCSPTRCAFLTGRYPQRVGIEWAIGLTAEAKRRVGRDWVPVPDARVLGLPSAAPSVARPLKQHGYSTALFGKWHLGSRLESNPLEFGFDEFFGILLGLADYYTKTYVDGMDHLYEGRAPVKQEGYLTDLITGRAVDFIGRQEKRPFFLYVPYNAVHWPFQPPDRPIPMDPKDTFKGTRDDYRRMLERVDDGVGRMLALLDQQGIADDTLFILSSDNGGERLSNNRPLFNHKTTLWEGGIRVPCLFRWPARLPKGVVSTQPGISMDLTATILAATGAQPPAEPLDGIDLGPILRGEKAPIPRTFFWRVARNDRKMKAVRHGDWKYVEDAMVPMLFNLKDDIGERTDRGFENPSIMAQLKELLSRWEAELAADPPDFVVN